MRQIKYSEFLDKIHGCWYGKCLGGAAGAPVEGIKKIIEIGDFTEIFNPDLPNDDLDLQLLWLDVLEKNGTNISSTDLADAWIDRCWYPFSEYGYFMKNYMRGIKPPYSGIINNSFFKEGMGCPIRSEIWGLISAGNPKLASQYAYIDATLDHADNSVWAEQFLSVIESMAFFENDIVKLIKIGMEYIPSSSKLSRCISSVLETYAACDTDWIKARAVVLNKFSHPDFSNVTQNLGFITIALLYGNGDMRATINIALKCGYDADCTCASAASIIGIIKGYSRLGEKITSLIKDYFVIGIDVKRPSNSIKQLANDVAKVALSVPNDCLKITDIPLELQNIKKIDNLQGFELEPATKEGLKKAKKSIKPVVWNIYGPYFEQFDRPMDPKFPSPHGEGCTLPDLECMVNNAVYLDKPYINEDTLDFSGESPICTIEAYEDLIEVDDYLTLEGQMCCYAQTTIKLNKDKKVWIVVGNNDGFVIWNNGQKIIERDEIRYWTPYNNFELIDLKAGENKLVIKLLRRTEKLKFAIGFRIYNGEHWHKSKWHADLF